MSRLSKEDWERLEEAIEHLGIMIDSPYLQSVADFDELIETMQYDIKQVLLNNQKRRWWHI